MIEDYEIDQFALMLSEKGFSHSQIDEKVIEHFGVAGMRWGVRRERRIQALRRAGKKGAPGISKVRSAGHLGPIDFLRGGGITGGSRRKAVRLANRASRVRQGKATTLDHLKNFGTAHVSDLIPVREKNRNKKTTVRADYVAVAVVGAVITGKLLARAARSNL